MISLQRLFHRSCNYLTQALLFNHLTLRAFTDHRCDLVNAHLRGLLQEPLQAVYVFGGCHSNMKVMPAFMIFPLNLPNLQANLFPEFAGNISFIQAYAT